MVNAPVYDQQGRFHAGLAPIGTKLSDMTGGFELFNMRALKQILARGIVSRGPLFRAEIKAFAKGTKISKVPIRYSAPSHGVGAGRVERRVRGIVSTFRDSAAQRSLII